jgi:hypothetical protein
MVGFQFLRFDNQDITLNVIVCDIRKISKVICGVIFGFEIQNIWIFFQHGKKHLQVLK